MKWAIAVIGVGAAAILGFEFSSYAICDGYYTLTVILHPSRPIKAVRCSGFATAEEARLVLNHEPLTGLESNAAIASPFVGDPLRLRIPISYCCSPLGRKWGDFQFRVLAVIVDRSDGSQTIQFVPIPHRRQRRVVEVRDES